MNIQIQLWQISLVAICAQNVSTLFLPLIYKTTYSSAVHDCSVAPSCLTVCDPMNWRAPGCSVHGIFWARILGWVAISFSRGSSRPRD